MKLNRCNVLGLPISPLVLMGGVVSGLSRLTTPMHGVVTKSEKMAARNARKVKETWLGAPPPDPRASLGGSAPQTPGLITF